MEKRITRSNANPYSKIFGKETCESSTSETSNQPLGFTAYYDAKGNRMSRDKLLDSIAEISPSPKNIFPDNDGYLLRFELDEPFDIVDEEHEKKLQQSILNFLEDNEVVTGKLQEMEIGKWEAHLVLLDDDGEVIEWLEA